MGYRSASPAKHSNWISYINAIAIRYSIFKIRRYRFTVVLCSFHTALSTFPICQTADEKGLSLSPLSFLHRLNWGTQHEIRNRLLQVLCAWLTSFNIVCVCVCKCLRAQTQRPRLPINSFKSVQVTPLFKDLLWSYRRPKDVASSRTDRGEIALLFKSTLRVSVLSLPLSDCELR